MANNLMYFPIDDTQITHSKDYNYWLKRSDTRLDESTNQNLKIKVPKVVEPMIKKTLLKNFED